MADRPLRIISKFTRRFIADDESASVITDVEADDDGHVVSSGGCPPLNLVSSRRLLVLYKPTKMVQFNFFQFDNNFFV